MKHKHYLLGMAKLNNMSLVIFIKANGQWVNQAAHSGLMILNEKFEHFACLPQFEKECLYWLNGGDIQVRSSEQCNWYQVMNWAREWQPFGCGFMNDGFDMRIKPIENPKGNALASSLYDLFAETAEADNRAVKLICGADLYKELKRTKSAGELNNSNDKVSLLGVEIVCDAYMLPNFLTVLNAKGEIIFCKLLTTESGESKLI